MADEVVGDEPRWLTADEAAGWQALVSAAAEVAWALDDQLQRSAGLSFVEYSALAMLADAPDRALRMSRLARLTHSSLSRLSHLVRRLEGRDLVRRAPDPTDGRYTIATLTDLGRQTLAAAAPAHVAEVRDLVLDRVGADQWRAAAAAARSVREHLGDRRPLG